MNPAQLLKHFDRISEAPDAIPRLRRFILDLAVRGKLVEQDPNDEPAAELLKRIQMEKPPLVRGRNQLNSAWIIPTKKTAAPFAIAPSWIWASFGDITISRDGERIPVSKEERNGRAKNFDYYGASGIIDKIDDYLFDKPLLLIAEDGANLINRSTPIAFIARGKYWVNNHAHVIDGISEDFLRYLELFINAIDLKPYITGTAQPKMNQAKMNSIPVALPPLAEQHRIIAKVDELMALCDQLEAAKTDREQRRDRLVAASLQRLNHPAEDAETFREDARFTFNHLPRLTTRPDHIKQLRQTILNLAVLGRLVPQNIRDQPGSELLKNIQLTCKNKRKNAILDVAELKIPLPDIPSNWTWAVVDQVASDDPNAITDGPFGANLKTEHYITKPGYRVIRLQNIGRGTFHEEHRSYIEQSRFNNLEKHHVYTGDLVVSGLVDPFIRCCEVPTNLGPALVKADCYRFSVHPLICSRFALHYLNSTIAQEFASTHNHGMTLTRIGLGNFRRIPFPLPPLHEQHRIVAKVDELMTICDQLKSQIEITESDNRRLLEAILQEALAPALEDAA